jgi:hypothetical protein
MKSEIALLPAVIGAAIYLCGLFMLSLYIIDSLSMVTIEAHFIAERPEMPF